MKKYFFYIASLAALAVTSCRKIETDGEKEIVIINGGGTGSNTGKRVELSGRITKDTTLRKGDENILKGFVYITKGVTLTIEKGAVVKGAYTGTDVAALCITRGGKIMAEGTQDEPIVFTSGNPNPQSGDWGGIVICGTARVNQTFNGTLGIFEMEGGINNAQGDALGGAGDAAFPTPNDADNSGKMRYVRIEYAGYAYQPDKELNSLTFVAVGSGTTIDHIQVLRAKDDAYEWFGGTVNCSYIIACKTQDDDLDTDNGYNGSVQFALVVRDSLIADVSRSEGMESDNNSTGATVTPQTKAVFTNITLIGPRATLNNFGNSLYLAGAQIRRNSSISIFNSAILGWPTGILIDAGLGRPTDLNIQDSSLRIRSTIIAGCNVPIKYTVSASAPTGASDATITSWFTTAYHGNSILPAVEDARYTRPFDYTNPDFQPFGTSPLNSGANFTDPLIAGRSGITTVAFRGGVGPSGEGANWYKGWTRFSNY